MGKKVRRAGNKVQLKRAYEDYTEGRVYHRPLIETKYWEIDPYPRFQETRAERQKPQITGNIEAPTELLKELPRTQLVEEQQTEYTLKTIDIPPVIVKSLAWRLVENDPREWLNKVITQNSH